LGDYSNGSTQAQGIQVQAGQAQNPPESPGPGLKPLHPVRGGGHEPPGVSGMRQLQGPYRYRDRSVRGPAIMTIENKVKKLISEKLEVDPADVVPKASLIDDLGADSLAIVEMIMTMEEQFDIEVPDEDAENLRTVEDAINYIIKKTQS
jgi:acyl carrier protein